MVLGGAALAVVAIVTAGVLVLRGESSQGTSPQSRERGYRRVRSSFALEDLNDSRRFR
ncbi:hypothetical protein [Prauserella cavernicola]|uniref:Uncharacterized protein n=1 Tax=Prauserella cavernicola TaxID=2800127 RepID=A0A934V7B1_9PSEU|nr:hypothetical protein [Prauserella cavernicola]MBK1788397.1 hypothetical protein [Prauserella cavernicola]